MDLTGIFAALWLITMLGTLAAIRVAIHYRQESLAARWRRSQQNNSIPRYPYIP